MVFPQGDLAYSSFKVFWVSKLAKLRVLVEWRYSLLLWFHVDFCSFALKFFSLYSSSKNFMGFLFILVWVTPWVCNQCHMSTQVRLFWSLLCCLSLVIYRSGDKSGVESVSCIVLLGNCIKEGLYCFPRQCRISSSGRGGEASTTGVGL